MQMALIQVDRFLSLQRHDHEHEAYYMKPIINGTVVGGVMKLVGSSAAKMTMAMMKSYNVTARE
jgi:hypothetical protein